MSKRRAWLGALTFLVLLGVPAAAWAQDDEDEPGSDDQVILTGRAEVAEGTTVDDLVIFDGPAIIAGTVRQSVVAFNGDVTVSGEVGDHVVAFNGRVTVESGATVGGDVRSRKAADIAEGADVQGVVGGVRWERYDWFETRWFAWGFMTVSTLVLGLLLLALVPRLPDALWSVATSRVGASIGWGLGAFIGLPILGVLALVTIVGIPLGIAILFGLWLIYMLGYLASTIILGRRLIRPPRSRFLAFLVGWGILRLLALIPFFGGVVWFVATAFGLGALFVAGWRARSAVPPRAEPAPTPAPA
jgi:hypothetical protein